MDNDDVKSHLIFLINEIEDYNFLEFIYRLIISMKKKMGATN